MRELTAAMDLLADSLEEVGSIKEAMQMDIYSNTLELLNKEAWGFSKEKTKPNQVQTEIPKNINKPQNADQYKPMSNKPTNSAEKVEQFSGKLKTEFKDILGYLDRYVNMLRRGDQTLLDNLGKDFPQKLKATMDDLRKKLIGSKMFLNKLEPDKGGLS
jgi:hypothetical protein